MLVFAHLHNSCLSKLHGNVKKELIAVPRYIRGGKSVVSRSSAQQSQGMVANLDTSRP